MKILDLRVDWYLDYGNDPVFEILVDKIPDRKLLHYENNAWAWFAELDGYVSFFSWRGPANEGGYGGSRFPITMKDGSEKVLLGPWSSGSYAMNAVGDFPQCLCVHMTDDKDVWQRGHTFMSGAVTLQLINDFLAEHPELNLDYERQSLGIGWHYVPCFTRLTPKESKALVMAEQGTI